MKELSHRATAAYPRVHRFTRLASGYVIRSQERFHGSHCSVRWTVHTPREVAEWNAKAEQAKIDWRNIPEGEKRRIAEWGRQVLARRSGAAE